jgi:acyl phosphate:glycerol-3-phosphate acyltransferase
LLLYVTAFAISYLIGSLPTAYIVVKRKANIDIRSAGSGNVGTLNAYEVTGKRFIGILVLVVDIAKGASAVLLTRLIISREPLVISIALVAVVVGHCFPIWLKFHGGRGLAPAAGAMLVTGWIFVILWLVSWGIGYWISKDIHVGNIVAIIAAPILGYLIPQEIIMRTIVAGFSVSGILLAYSAMSVALLVRHIEPLRTVISTPSKKDT